MKRRTVWILAAATFIVLCGITAVQAGSRPSLLPEDFRFPNPLRSSATQMRSLAGVSEDLRYAGTYEQSACGERTDYLGITNGVPALNDPCGSEQAALHLTGPYEFLVECPDGALTAFGNSGALFLGSTELGMFTPGVEMVAYAHDSQEYPRALLLLSVWPWEDAAGGDISLACLGALGSVGETKAGIYMLNFDNITGGASIEIDADDVGIEADSASMTSSSGAGLSMDGDGNVIIQLGQSQ